MQRIKNNFMIGTIIAFLEAVKKDPASCLHDIYYRTGLTLATMIPLRDALYLGAFIEKRQINLLRTNLKLTLKGERLLSELKMLQ